MIKQNWYQLDILKITTKLKTNLETGLKSSDISSLQKKYGKNQFDKKRGWGIVGKIFSQFKNPLIFILLVAGFLTLFLKEYTDAIVIFLALGINTLIGTIQENRAGKAFEEINKSQQKFATVIRDGKKSVILAKELVRGDIVIIESGMSVPADIRLFEERDLLINESVLTGEWADVQKTTGVLNKDFSIIKQTNMLWMGSLVSAGRGKGIVVEIGENTQIGEIAKSLREIGEEETPIKENINKIAKFLTIIVVVSLVIIFGMGVLRGEEITTMLLIAVAVAVAVIPEGLPAAVTSVLAVGMSEILKKGGLVRNLLAAETLGSTTVILTDKTGTITEAKMHLSELFTTETFKSKNYTLDNGDNKELLKYAVLSSDAFFEEKQETDSDELIVRGRPLEKAIILAGLETGLSQEELFKKFSRLDFVGFDSKNGFSISLNKNIEEETNLLLVSGKPELLLQNSDYFFINGKEEKMSEEIKELFEKIQKEKSSEGIRFTAIAYKKTSSENISEKPKKITDNLVFVGLLAFSDPIRSDAKQSIKEAQQAGAKVIMITGDNPNTARKIAEDVGIIKKGEKVLTGDDVEKMKDNELIKELETVMVFARMIPAQKLRISKLLQKQGEVVAMTGDGINDAPALQSADIGIAMGSGTDVAKEASDLILIDGNFSVITHAIEEGRRAIDNLKKIVSYLLSTSFSEIFLIGGSLLAGFPLPLLPGQILWANIVEEGFMNFAFVFEPKEDDLMKRNPRLERNKNVLNEQVKKMIFIISIITGLFLLVIYYLLLQMNLPIEEVRTFMFVALSIDSIFFSFSLKSLKKPIWKEDLFSNRYLIFALSASILFLLMAVFFSPIQKLLSLVPLNYSELLCLFGIGIFNLILIEITKFFVFKLNIID